MVYGRRVGDRTLSFGVSGKLWRNSLVMYDRETGSEWSQLTGRALSGPLRGARLEKLAASDRTTTLADWRRRFPALKVLREREITTPGGDVYAQYHRSDETGIRPVLHRDPRLPPKQLVIGVEVGAAAYAIPTPSLEPGTTRRFPIEGGDLVLRRTSTGVSVVEAPAPAEAVIVYWFVWSDVHPETVLLPRTPSR